MRIKMMSRALRLVMMKRTLVEAVVEEAAATLLDSAVEESKKSFESKSTARFNKTLTLTNKPQS